MNEPPASAPRAPSPPDASSSPARSSSRGGCLAFLVAAALWWVVLNGFAAPGIVALLTVLGAGLVVAGVYLAFASLPHTHESLWYVVTLLVGLLLLAGAAATLLPAAPGTWLASTATGWEILERRTDRLSEAIQEGDVKLARKLASRGLGDAAASDGFGVPLLHLAKDPEMLDALLASGLDPDARDQEGRTLLMKRSDLEVTRRLLAAGADPNARTRDGVSVLMLRGDEEAALVELLLEAGADVHAVDQSGRSVADMVRGPGRALLERYAGGRALGESGWVTVQGRNDWLEPAAAESGIGETVVPAAPVAPVEPDSIVLEPRPLRPGQVGAVTVRLANASEKDRLLDVQATLDNAVLFVGASRDGVLETSGRPGPTGTVRWPLLALPAGRQGRLELEVVALADDAVPGHFPGDLSIDVTVTDLPDRAESVLHLYQERAPETAAGGRERTFAGWIGALVFSIPLLLLWLYVARQAKRGRHVRAGRVVAGLAAAACGLAAGALVFSIAESFVRFEETSCRILDHRVVTRVVEPSTTDTSTARRPSTYGVPVAAVEIAHGTGSLVATGFAVGQTRSLQELRSLPIGSEVPCWVDPGEPARFTLVRGPGARAVVGFVLLAVTGLALAVIAVRLRPFRSRAQSS